VSRRLDGGDQGAQARALPAPERGIGAVALAARHELIGLYGVVERNWYLVKRYALWEIAFFVWTIANTLSIVFISKTDAISPEKVNELTTRLLIGAVIWAYLGIVFEILTETVAWERWEGTIEYTFMAPLSRPVHLIGMGLFAIAYGVVRAALVFGAIAAMFSLHMPRADFGSALLLLAIASISFIGVGMMTAVLPLISPEKGTQLGFMAQGTMLVVSGVYYPVSVLPGWMQTISTISPATYALRGIRDAIVNGAGPSALWDDIWPLLVIGAVSVPLGLWVFWRGEQYAKKHGKLKRSG
jgi:ABC-2 type transport system permease protein